MAEFVNAFLGTVLGLVVGSIIVLAILYMLEKFE
tara:strand:+ start:93 stop:194 length:102 start_codon:yes stop_codon:yes gene_type:complete